MDEGDRAINLKEEPTEETDQEKMLRETTSLLRQSENCMFTIQVSPGTTMHIHIAPESVLELDTDPENRVTASWCISTLMIHNGQHYANTIHNFTVSPELIRNLMLAREPVGNILQQLMMNPLELPSTSLQLFSPRSLADGRFVHPTAIFRMVEHYCNYVMRTARILDNVFGWVVPERSSELPALMQDIRVTSQTLQSMLDRVQHSVQIAEQCFAPNESMGEQEEDPLELELEPEREPEPEPEQLQIYEDVSSDSDDDMQLDLRIAEAQNSVADFVGFDDFDDAQMKSDSDSSSSDSEIQDSVFLGPSFEETPQQFWSLTSSDEDNDDEQPDEESWESDFGDDDSFDAYMVRQLRAHASGLATRLNTGWGHLPNDTAQADDDEWDLGSCGTNAEIEDVRSELSYDSEDLNAWQYREDRSFETELSRPFRRLVGDLPPQTAQEERYAWRHSYEHFDFRRSLFAALEVEGPNRTIPFSYYSQWDQQDTLAFTSSASSLSDGPGFGQNAEPYPFSIYASAMESINSSLQPDATQLQGIELDDVAHARAISLARTNSDSDVDQLTMDLDTETRQIPPDQQIVPLESFVQQTDELIAKILASL
ncbi:uncharacterized protein LOC6585578 [Drosophila mojavensis]|uniref:Uncharacterized protein n=1 Tax=Drosophila mojavensis TaxID=7230 RepID=B4L6Q2_DROMO|nr:uncharacterized protein LOC6585578 [Drosophila mojavensis]EDW06048.1 uncharacterized protein Dmoj_GI16134 [Drosophila mojavensis]